MAAHELWHVAVLASTILAAAGLGVLVLGPLLFEEPSPGLTKARPLVIALVAMATAILVLEWLAVH